MSQGEGASAESLFADAAELELSHYQKLQKIAARPDLAALAAALPGDPVPADDPLDRLFGASYALLLLTLQVSRKKEAALASRLGSGAVHRGRPQE